MKHTLKKFNIRMSLNFSNIYTSVDSLKYYLNHKMRIALIIRLYIKKIMNNRVKSTTMLKILIKRPFNFILKVKNSIRE
jgi:hypothetical protein